MWLSDKESTSNAGDAGLIPGSGRSPEGGHGNPLQYSCLENSMDRGAWQATIHGVTKRDMAEHTHTQKIFAFSLYFSAALITEDLNSHLAKTFPSTYHVPGFVPGTHLNVSCVVPTTIHKSNILY